MYYRALLMKDMALLMEYEAVLPALSAPYAMISFIKRALYSIKRAISFIKRALYSSFDGIQVYLTSNILVIAMIS